MRNKRFPKYPDDVDYNTNSSSYYDDLARKQKLIEMLAKKIWEYEETLDLTLEDIEARVQERFSEWDGRIEKFPENVELLLQEWLTDGTIDHIIYDTIFNSKAEKTVVASEIRRLDQKDIDLTTNLMQTNIEKVGGGVKAELEDLSPNVLSAIEGGEGTSFELLSIPQDKSVTPEKTTFAKTKNLFDGVYTKGASLTGATLDFSTSYPGSISVIKKIEPNTTYTISKASDSDRFTIGTFLEYPINEMSSNRVIKTSGLNIPTTFTTTANEQYVVIYVSSSTTSKEPSWLQIEFGSIATDHGDVSVKLSSESFGNIKLPNHIVTPEKTTFAKTKNLFDGVYTRDYSLAGADDLTFEYGQGAVVAIHKVDSGITYTISKSYDTNRFVVGSFSEYPVHGADAKRAIKVASFSQPVTFTAEENEKYIVVYVSNSSESKEPEWLQIELGEVATEPNEVDIKLSKKSLTVPFAKQGRNVFDGNYVNDLILLTPNESGRFVVADRTGGKMIVQELTVGETYTVYKSRDTDRFRIGSSNTIPKDSDEITVIKAQDTNEPYSFTLNEKYLIVYVSSPSENKIPSKFQIEKSEVFTEYVDPDSPILEVDPHTFSDHIPNKYVVVNQVKENYTNTNSYLPYSRVVGNEVLDNLYEQWDDLVTHDPNYVSRNLEGYEATGLPIYSYEFKPKIPQGNPSRIKHPKIIYTGGIHGMERFCNYEDLRFFKDLVYNWEENDVLSLLRSNLHIVVVPVVNPWGFANLKRGNSNGVDLNRNFGFDFKETAEGKYYSGTHALSEIESQLMVDLMKRHKDAILGIDHHNYNNLSTDGHVAYFGSKNRQVEELAFSLATFLDGDLKRKVPSLVADQPINDTRNLFMTMNENTSQGLASHFTKEGINGMLYESIGGSWGAGYTESNETLQNILVDIIGNLLATFLIHNERLSQNGNDVLQ